MRSGHASASGRAADCRGMVRLRVHLCMGGAQIDPALESSKSDVLARSQHVGLTRPQRLEPGILQGVGLRRKC